MSPPVPRWYAAPARRGFTLVELVIVVMVLGVLAGIAAPRYEAALTATHLDAAAKRLAADLRRARSVARATATTVTVTFDLAASAYRCAALPDPDHPHLRLDVGLTQRGHGVVMQAAAFGGQPNLAFSFRGDASAAGSVTLAAGGRSKVVTVSETGLVGVTP